MIDNLENKTVDELKALKDECWKDYIEIKDMIARKEIEQYDFEKQYIKVYLPLNDEPIYMHVYSNYITYNVPFKSDNKAHIWLQGETFKCSFTNYVDATYFDYDQMDDIYIKIDDFLLAESKRKDGKMKPGDHDYNNNRIEVITKEEYKHAFESMADKSREYFNLNNKI